MARRGASRHRKRYNTPLTYPIERKVRTFIIRPYPSGHPFNKSVPVGVLIRDLLGYAKRYDELKKIFARGEIHVDKRRIRKIKYAIGYMDVLEIPKDSKAFRVTPSATRQGYSLVTINDQKDTEWKLCKVIGKKMIKKGRLQLNLHDGRNIHVNPREDVEGNNRLVPESPELSEQLWEIRPRDTLMIHLPNQYIMKWYRFEEGAWLVITDGTNQGKVGRMVSVEKRIGRNRSIVTMESENEEIRTALENVFVVGGSQENAPAIPIPKPEEARLIM